MRLIANVVAGLLLVWCGPAAGAELALRFWVVGHRGDMANSPENTMRAVLAAWKTGANFAEVDVRATADGELVLMHDATVDKTTDGKGKLKDLTAAEVQMLDAGITRHEAFKGERVPTLKSVLAAGKSNDRGLFLHLKERATFRQVARLVAEASPGSERVALLIDRPDLAHALEVFGRSKTEIWVAVNGKAEAMSRRQVEGFARAGVAGLMFAYYGTFPTKEEIDKVRDAGVRFGLVTPSGGSDVVDMLKSGVDAYVTNFPGKAMSVVREKFGKREKGAN